METINIEHRRKVSLPLIILLILLALLLCVVVGFVFLAPSQGSDALTYNLAEPLGDVTTAKISIDPGDGNLTIDSLTGGEQLLAGGSLQYPEGQDQPNYSLESFNGQATYTLSASESKQSWLKLPWAACNGATEWNIHLNPTVSYDVTAHSDGGNIILDLAGMAITNVSADTGGGNIEVNLPDNMAALRSVSAKTGAGNVVIRVPAGIAARIHATSGLGKVIMDPRFILIDDDTYQSPDYDSATEKVEFTLDSGAGNVSVETK